MHAGSREDVFELEDVFESAAKILIGIMIGIKNVFLLWQTLFFVSIPSSISQTITELANKKQKPNSNEDTGL